MRIKPDRQALVTLAALAVCMAMQMTGFMMILPLFALRLESFGAGVKALGISASAYALAGMLCAPFMGMLADRFGRRPIILLSLTAYLLAFSGYLFVASAWLFIVLRGLAGVFTSGLVPAVTSTAGDLAAENRRAQWIGIVMGGASVGWILGPYFGGLLYDHFGHAAAFGASIAMELGALLLAASIVRETRVRLDRVSLPRESRMPALGVRHALPAFYMLMLISFGIMFAWAFIEPQFMFYAYDDLGWSPSRLGLVMSTYGLACMLGEFTVGHLSDRMGRKPVLVLGLALFSAQFVGLIVFRDAAWLMAGFILAGLGTALLDPALSAHLLDITPPGRSARIMGMRATAGSFGNMLGPALAVLFTSFGHARAVFITAAGLVFVLTLASALILRVAPGRGVTSQLSSTAASR